MGGANLALRSISTGQIRETLANAEGVFRWLDLPPGHYALKVESEGYAPFEAADLRLDRGEVVTLEITLKPIPLAPATVSRVPRLPELGPLPPPSPELAAEGAAPYRVFRRRVDFELAAEELQPEVLPPAEEVFLAMPDRWDVPMPEWRRYGKGIDAPYAKGRWWDPDRKSTRLNSSHIQKSRMPSSA